MKHTIFFLVLSFATAAGAAPNCPNTVDMYQGVQAQSLWYQSSGACAVQIMPVRRPAQWRSFLFFSTGLFMVFDNLGAGPEATDTASRSFFIFPRRRNPKYSFRKSGVNVKLASGETMAFNLKDATILRGSGIDVVENPDITPENEGGVVIRRHAGIIVDTGYMIGEVAHSDPNRKSLIRDSRDRSCELPNSSLFNYQYDTDAYGKRYLQAVTFKFATDPEFGDFLKKSCPQIDTTPLSKSKLIRSPRKKGGSHTKL